MAFRSKRRGGGGTAWRTGARRSTTSPSQVTFLIYRFIICRTWMLSLEPVSPCLRPRAWSVRTSSTACSTRVAAGLLQGHQEAPSSSGKCPRTHASAIPPPFAELFDDHRGGFSRRTASQKSDRGCHHATCKPAIARPRPPVPLLRPQSLLPWRLTVSLGPSRGQTRWTAGRRTGVARAVSDQGSKCAASSACAHPESACSQHLTQEPYGQERDRHGRELPTRGTLRAVGCAHAQAR